MHTNMIFQFQKVNRKQDQNLLNWENLKDRSTKLVQQINEILHDTK